MDDEVETQVETDNSDDDEPARDKVHEETGSVTGEPAPGAYVSITDYGEADGRPEDG